MREVTSSVRAVLAACVGAAIVLAHSTANAEQATESIAVIYNSPSICPDRAAFVGQVLARTSHARVVLPAEARRSFGVAITGDRGRWTPGHLTSVSEAGTVE